MQAGDQPPALLKSQSRSNIEPEADLSAYPVIRIDQISLLDKSTLTRAKVDVSELLTSLRTDEPSSQMIFYLQKQLDAMSAEEVRRDAEQRVFNLLAGIEDALGPQSPMPQQSTFQLESQRSTLLSFSPFTASNSTGNKVALTTEARESLSAPGDFSKEADVSRDLGFSPPTSTKQEQSVYVPLRDRSASAKQRSSTEELDTLSTVEMRQDGRKDYPDINHRSLHSGTDEDSPLNSRTHSAERTSTFVEHRKNTTDSGSIDAYQSVVNRDRKIEQNEIAIRKEKQKAVLNATFGNTFVVQSTHKKIRFFTKKVSVESPEAKMAREKDARREAAMQRLLERQKERERERNLLKQKKADEKAKRQGRRKKGVSLGTHQVYSAANLDSDDSDESISGGSDNEYSFGDRKISEDRKDTSKERDNAATTSYSYNHRLSCDAKGILRGRMQQPTKTISESDTAIHVQKKTSKGKRRDVSSTSQIDQAPVGPRKVLIDGLIHHEIDSPNDLANMPVLSSFGAPSPHRPAPQVDEESKQSLDTVIALEVEPDTDPDIDMKSMVDPVNADVASTAEPSSGFGEEASLNDSGEISSASMITPRGFRVDDDVQEKCMSALDTLRLMKRKKDEERDKGERDDNDNTRSECLESMTSIVENSEPSIDSVCLANSSTTNAMVSGDSPFVITVTATQGSAPVISEPMDFTTMIASSQLLSIRESERSVSEEQCTSFIGCNKLVDAIPGLAVWRLVAQGDPTGKRWEFHPSGSDDRKQNEAEESLFEHRSNVFKMLPSGFVCLLFEMEALIMDRSCNQSEIKVVPLWRNIIRRFDQRASSGFYKLPRKLFPSNEASDHENDLLRQVSVCGNCFAACSKLQRLFLSPPEMFPMAHEEPIETTTHAHEVGNESSVGHNQIGVDNDPDNSDMQSASRLDPKVVKALEERGLLEDLESLIDLEAEHLSQLLDLPPEFFAPDLFKNRILNECEKTVSGVRPFSTGTGREIKESMETQVMIGIIDRYSFTEGDDDDFIEPIYIKTTKNELSCGANSDRNVSDDDGVDVKKMKSTGVVDSDIPVDGDCEDSFDSDDDAFIVPSYTRDVDVVNVKSVTMPKREMNRVDKSKEVLDCCEKTAAKEKCENSYDLHSSIQKDLSEKLVESGSESNERVKLCTYYESLGMIFPFAYTGSGDAKTLDYSRIGKLLVNSVVQQAKQYEEWLEIMNDYSTVFSSENKNKKGVNKVVNDATDASNGNDAVYSGTPRTLHYRVTSSRSDVLNIVNDVFTELYGWEELPSGLGLGTSWNLLWTWSRPKLDMNHLLIWQRVNHFTDSKQLTRKDLLKQNLQRFTNMSGRAAASFEIMPQSFVLPHEYTSFVRAFTEAESTKSEDPNKTNNIWILKPVGLSRGRGISLVKDICDLSFSNKAVVQKYIDSPLCLDGYKFDLRLYVLVSSFRPLEAFLYKEGFARVSTQQYSSDRKTFDNLFIHLTNSSVQRRNSEGPTADNPLSSNGAESNGSKLPLGGENGLWSRFRKIGIDADAIWKDITVLVLKSLVVVDTQMIFQPCSFEIFGYDVLIDQNLKPWLLEVNASPSLSRDNELDYRVKGAMVSDTIKLIDPAPFDREALPRVLRRRLKESKSASLSVRNDTKMEDDLHEILGDYVPRRYGEVPKHLGEYEMLCPNTKAYSYVMKLKRSIFREQI